MGKKFFIAVLAGMLSAVFMGPVTSPAQADVSPQPVRVHLFQDGARVHIAPVGQEQARPVSHAPTVSRSSTSAVKVDAVYVGNSRFQVQYQNGHFTQLSGLKSCPVGQSLVVAIDGTGDNLYEWSREVNGWAASGWYQWSPTGAPPATSYRTGIYVGCGGKSVAARTIS
jgi:hypothetical protein